VNPITIDLPCCLSTNRRRKIDWASQRAHKAWLKNADAHVLVAKSKGLKLERIKRFEIEIMVDHSGRIDLDNLKQVPDYLKRIGMIFDDKPSCMQAVHIVQGDAPAGLRITITPLNGT
jgi:Holliday junction resolvase RusA-like endonuclease